MSYSAEGLFYYHAQFLKECQLSYPDLRTVPLRLPSFLNLVILILILALVGSMASVLAAFNGFLLLCLFACFIQAQGRPGKPFFACRSYIVSISFSSPNHHHPLDESLAIAMPVENEKLEVYEEEFLNEEDQSHVVYSWGFINNPNPSHKTIAAHKKKVGSFQRRAEDVLSIVFALLLGALSGAITATLIHMVWSISTSRFSSSTEEEDDMGAVIDPMDFSYEKLPTKEGVEVEAK